MKATFIKSSKKVEDCPFPDKPEYAFLGRSNVGKSSLINMLVQRKNLAATSAQPGKTRLINHFLVDERWYLADLPGYGYAKVSKQERAAWQKIINDYLTQRPNLMCTFILMDLRLEPQAIDLEMIERLGSAGLPLAFVFTKADKLSRNQQQSNFARYRRALLQMWEELPPCFITSAVDGSGRDEILQFIEEVNQSFVFEPNEFKRLAKGGAPLHDEEE
ncbi:MAG: putative GTP-binding protein EngB [Thermonema sp.]|uniref:ribosome biogenesis GTP-binding protein YihA/YsxC n=1 Tax=Thermonema sp. TaxID=2231181 RepID=UPI0021DD65B8|nr:ribosome biogenesis GTP-binding protein YihA/YsxC [Thermonema sp.]GIV39094.1 MAG: putative GTP-binding protein EngB [Thermonema sp.]